MADREDATVRGATSIATDPTLEDIDPFMRLLAAVFTLAVHDARQGDGDARQWIDEHGAAVASVLIPSSVDPMLVVQRLMTGAE